MKKIESKDLVIGQVYSDTPNLQGCTTFLKFLGYDADIKSCSFEYVKGSKSYIDINGIILLSNKTKFYK